jgi:glucose-1-phosphate adenylyltransferase
VRAHIETNAKITLAVRSATGAGAGSQAWVTVDAAERVVALTPSCQVEQSSADTDVAESEHLETMGVYLFEKDVLLDLLGQIQRGAIPDEDVGMDVVARMVNEHPVYAYQFGQTRGRVTPDRYWCDLASIDAYYQANMALLLAEPPLDLYQDDWNIHTYQGQYPPARTVPGAVSGTEGVFVNSMLAAGTIISGGGVNHSILFPRVRVNDGAIVEASILFDGVVVGAGAHLSHCIVEKDVEIPPKEQIGFDLKLDRARFTVSEQGVVVIPKGAFA